MSSQQEEEEVETAGAVVVVEHQPAVSSGLFGQALLEAGVALDFRQPYLGQPLPNPEELAAFGGLVVLGGSMAAWEEDVAPWIPEVRHLVQVADQREVPTLGICLGHQLTAAALGGKVHVNPLGRTVGVLPVGWTDAADADPMFRGVGAAVAVHGNRDVVVEAPGGAQVLAVSPDGTIQAARWGRSVWGTQFHPEVGPEIVGRWVAESSELFEGVDTDADEFLAEVHRHEDQLLGTVRRMAQNFAALVRARRA